MGYMVHILVSLLLCELTRSASIPFGNNGGQSNPKGFGTAKRAVIIGIDGLGGLHLRNATHYFPTLRSFFEQGSYTTHARGVFPTRSGPNWITHLTGMGVMEHGVFDNDWTVQNSDPENEHTYSIPPMSGRGRADTIFTQVKRKDSSLKTAMMFTWQWLQFYAVNNTDIDEWFWGAKDIDCSINETAIHCYNRKDNNTMFHATENLLKNDPVLTFVHLDHLDAAGHYTCWGCPEYYQALGAVEQKIAFLIDALSHTHDATGKPMLEETLIAVVSDHGGWRDTHTYDQPFGALVDIPVLIRGPGVRSNNSLEETYVSNLDVVPTVLNAIGVEKSELMRGRVLEEIYV